MENIKFQNKKLLRGIALYSGGYRIKGGGVASPLVRWNKQKFKKGLFYFFLRTGRNIFKEPGGGILLRRCRWLCPGSQPGGCGCRWWHWPDPRFFQKCRLRNPINTAVMRIRLNYYSDPDPGSGNPPYKSGSGFKEKLLIKFNFLKFCGKKCTYRYGKAALYKIG